jgi:hypothetical protein
MRPACSATSRSHAGRRVSIPAMPLWPASRPPHAMIYVNCDASYRDGWAGIAYVGEDLESGSQLVECETSTEGELRAVLLAMTAAEKAHLLHVTFRTDCESAARPHRGKSEPLRLLRDQTAGYLSQHPGWAIAQVSRVENKLANALARQACRSHYEVAVNVDSGVAASLIERAGIEETSAGHWRLTSGKTSSSINAALSAALMKLATDATSNATCAGLQA